jgi:hypothetical protein
MAEAGEFAKGRRALALRGVKEKCKTGWDFLGTVICFAQKLTVGGVSDPDHG